MRCLLAIAVFLAGATFPFTLSAQSFRPTLAPRGVESFHGGHGFSPFRGGAQPVVFPAFFGYPSNYPFQYFYPGLWPPLDYQYQQASRIAHGDVAAEVAAQEKELLSSQVQALTEELRSLRQEQASRQLMQAPTVLPRAELPLQPSPRARSRAEKKFPPTVFIYRDGREMEARDYAIFGGSLWVFQGQTARKFPLADFNLEASRQVNEEHGVAFPLSGQPRQ
jgi:hypothetical protein